MKVIVSPWDKARPGATSGKRKPKASPPMSTKRKRDEKKAKKPGSPDLLEKIPGSWMLGLSRLLKREKGELSFNNRELSLQGRIIKTENGRVRVQATFGEAPLIDQVEVILEPCRYPNDPDAGKPVRMSYRQVRGIGNDDRVVLQPRSELRKERLEGRLDRIRMMIQNPDTGMSSVLRLAERAIKSAVEAGKRELRVIEAAPVVKSLAKGNGLDEVGKKHGDGKARPPAPRPKRPH